MANELREFIRSNPPKGFTPSPYFSKEGDFLTFYFEDADHYAHRVDQFLTVYLAMDGKRLVGFKIKGVQRIIRILGRFKLTRTVPDGKRLINMNFLLMPGMSVANDEQMEHYVELDEATANIEFDARQLEPELV